MAGFDRQVDALHPGFPIPAAVRQRLARKYRKAAMASIPSMKPQVP